jgi:hypothetical protein
MELTCKLTDRSIFEELGFTVESECYEWEFPGCVKMVDREANYAHAGDLPKDVVYFGTHRHTDILGPEAFACDGHTYLEQLTDGGWGFAVWFDDEGNPTAASLAKVKSFVTHRNNVKSILARKKEGARKARQRSPSPGTNFSPAKGEMIDAKKP